MPNVIQYDVSFSVPIGEAHTYAQFEAVTGYMPAEFSRFLKYNATTKTLEALTDGPGEQAWPVVLATDSGSHAMGIFSPDQPCDRVTRMPVTGGGVSSPQTSYEVELRVSRS